MPTILCVDDDPTQLTLLQFAFERVGFTIFTAANGQEAIASLQVQRPDIILMDLMMPQKNGYVTTSEIKALPDFADIPIILYTAYAQSELAEQAKAAGAADVIRKMTPPKKLAALIHELLDTHQAQG